MADALLCPDENCQGVVPWTDPPIDELTGTVRIWLPGPPKAEFPKCSVCGRKVVGSVVVAKAAASVQGRTPVERVVSIRFLIPEDVLTIENRPGMGGPDGALAQFEDFASSKHPPDLLAGWAASAEAFAQRNDFGAYSSSPPRSRR